MNKQEKNLENQLEKVKNWGLKFEVGKPYLVDGTPDVFVEEMKDEAGLPVYRFKKQTIHWDFAYMIKSI